MSITERLKQRAKLWQPWIDDGEFTEMGFSVETMQAHQKLDTESADRIAELEAKVRELDVLNANQKAMLEGRHQYVGQDFQLRLRMKESELTASRQQVETLVEALKKLHVLARRRHRYCEDSWYSCPKADEGCANPDEGEDCNCGATDINEQADKLLTAALAAIEQERRQ